MNIKAVAKKWLPSALIGHLKPLLKYGMYYSGNYSDWSIAEAHATGYDSGLILERVKQARLKVMAGDAIYERDSVLFDEVQHSFPVLAGLMRAAIENGGELSVLDFGGSLGSSYYQCCEFLPMLSTLKWGVVEQEHFVKCGREQFENGHLKFYYTIAECIQHTKPNVVLLSNVLQYLPKPYAILDELLTSQIPYIIIDRTTFSKEKDNRITIQQVPASIYTAKIPLWIFGEESFLKTFCELYEVIACFESGCESEISNGLEFALRGMILRRM